mmetsp:Transcript_24711/g.51389  ORF Transcript_24711/g.51389 Transcript_24711/m.51389 type:complete len:403 (-) Transcript_24711:164-1372(-)
MSSPEIEVSWEDHEAYNDPAVSELDQLKARLRWAEENMRALSEGVRTIASQLMVTNQQEQSKYCRSQHHKRSKSTDSDDNATHATAEETIISEDMGSFHECINSGILSKNNSLMIETDELPDILSTERMAPLPASDLLALQNAAQMVKEHVRLSSVEASVAVEDTIQAQTAAREWQRRALAAEAELKHTRKQAARFQSQNQKLVYERKVLCREVRKVRKELADTKQQDLWGQLECYMTQALNIHENQLKQPTPSITPSSSQENNNESASPSGKQKQEKPSARFPSAFGNIGNALGFGTVSSTQRAEVKPQPKVRREVGRTNLPKATDETTTPPHSPGRSDSEENQNNRTASIEPNDSFGSSTKMVSPITFVESPSGSGGMSTVPICDPHVLRSLALPPMNGY